MSTNAADSLRKMSDATDRAARTSQIPTTGLDPQRAERIRHAEERSAHWLMAFNELEEAGKGDSPKAQAAYEKSSRWLMRANDLRGW